MNKFGFDIRVIMQKAAVDTKLGFMSCFTEEIGNKFDFLLQICPYIILVEFTKAIEHIEFPDFKQDNHTEAITAPLLTMIIEIAKSLYLMFWSTLQTS